MGCQGKALYDIKKQEFKVYNKCNFDINHENYKFEDFIQIYNKNTYDKIDINLKIYQRYFIRALFKFKQATDKIDAFDIFRKKFGNNIEFKLTDNVEFLVQLVCHSFFLCQIHPIIHLMTHHGKSGHEGRPARLANFPF